MVVTFFDELKSYDISVKFEYLIRAHSKCMCLLQYTHAYHVRHKKLVIFVMFTFLYKTYFI